MTRALVLAFALVACGKKADAPKKQDAAATGASASDASLVVADGTPSAPSADALPATADIEPTSPPPAPTKRGSKRGDCKSEYAPRPTRDPSPMCKVEGGTFMMGVDSTDKSLADSTPAHKVRVKPFFIDRFEVTVQQVAFYLNTVKNNECPGAPDDNCFVIGPGGVPDLLLEKDGVISPVPGTELLPMTLASRLGAERYCAWVGKRLPTSPEWEYAARHDPKTGRDLVYPWGDTFEKNRTNCANASCGDRFEREAPVGSFDGRDGRGDDSSPFGVHDMVGNASELTSTCMVPYTPCAGACDEASSPTPTCDLVERTQSWSFDAKLIDTYGRAPFLGGSTGFRCATDGGS